jgi:3-oxoadipate:acetyl-CoA acetyltransferase
MNLIRDPLIINLAPTGAVADPVRNPHVPVSETDIVRDVVECASLGVAMTHLHVRDESGGPSSDPVLFRSLIRSVRAHPQVAGLVLCGSTSGRHGQTTKQRAAVLHLPPDDRPDMASLTLSSLNFGKGASINAPDTIRFLARTMLDQGIKPELEVFDLGMVHFAKALIREGLLLPPHFFNLILGNVAGAQCSLSDLSALVSQLPSESIWSLGGIGRSQRPAAGLGCMLASGVRIGLEDNLWEDVDRRAVATNPGLVRWLRDLAGAYGRPLADPNYVRQKLMGAA